MDPSNQPPGATPPPPAYQNKHAGYSPSFPSQPVPQGSYAQGPYPGQTVVAMQPAVNLTFTPLANPEPDYLCYSIFTMMCCCCSFLGIGAMVFSSFTRNANYSGQRALAEKNSKMARILNHLAVAVGITIFVLLIISEFVLTEK
ncbi:hypothetical protein ABG768_009176 [Culter alburnus]|uniref:Uncharacterized protein n=1 Tax=Culter alburnus TaxID=194366 RepID=A0AAW1ZJ37_CULAL